MHWRPHLPENCPPEDAKQANGTFYRLVSKRGSQFQDFLSYRELGREPDISIPECEFCAVSIFSEIEGIKSLIRQAPGLKKTKLLAKGSLLAKHGKIKNTPSSTHDSHHSWWIPEDMDPSDSFRLMEFP